MRRFLVALVAFTAMMTGVVLAAVVPDVGPKADVAAVRAVQHQRDPQSVIIAVHVVGDYALLNWVSGEASGPGVFKRISSERWKRIGGDGGAITLNQMVQLGVPFSVASQLCSGWRVKQLNYSPCSL